MVKLIGRFKRDFKSKCFRCDAEEVCYISKHNYSCIECFYEGMLFYDEYTRCFICDNENTYGDIREKIYNDGKHLYKYKRICKTCFIDCIDPSRNIKPAKR